MNLASKIVFIALPAVVTLPAAAAHGPRACSTTARVLEHACEFEVHDDYLTQSAVCLNLPRADQRECRREARVERHEGRSECRAIHRARRDLCDQVGEAAYAPPFGPRFADHFVDPLAIGASVAPNPYFPLITGNTWVYEGTFEDDGEIVTETVTVTVTDQTKEIAGITCVVVTDLVTEDGATIEDTDDWYAQDVEGNVWYCGEISRNFESFEGDDPEEPELVDIDGSWKTGRDGAKAGILLPAFPQVGEVFRQEVAWSEAEDVIEILDLSGTESSPAANCTNTCLVTRDFTPLEPETNENKYYLPGLGLILEVDLESGDRVELIEFRPGT